MFPPQALAQPGLNPQDLAKLQSIGKHVAKVKTPAMFIHRENDNDAPIAEAEQLFIFRLERSTV
jgi:dipeptidyl aminopeptidase/acylaminoacyl peptidase